MQIHRLSNQLRFSLGAYWLTLGLIVTILILIIMGSSFVLGNSSTDPGNLSVFNRLPLAFVASQGQDDTADHFEMRGPSNTLAFTPEEITFQIQEQTVRLNFIDTNPESTIAAGEALPGKVNDFSGNDPTQWRTNLATYASIDYPQLYPGIDLRYEGTDGLLKSTFTVAPGADPGRISWQYHGATAVAVDETSGDLLVTLPDQSQLVEKMPVAWQDIDGKRVSVPVAFAPASDGSVGFTLSSYNTVYPLVIDPTIVYETIINIGSFGRGLDVAVDEAGNTYILAGIIDLSNDVVIAKLSPSGTLLYTTYVRGSRIDYGGGIALDSSGDIYLAGFTDSEDFPILNAIKPVKEGVTREAFITKLAAEDGVLLFSTYFGGSRSDSIYDITLNSTGDIYVVGYTESTDFPTVNPIQAGLNLNQCFCEDTFVTRLSPDAQTVLYSTYLGGSFEDYGQSIALDASDNIYITGRTQSDDFPTQAAFQPNRASGGQGEDLFVSKISADGSTLVYSTYLGGTRDESARRIAVDSAGNAFVAGYTRSSTFPTTAGAYRETYIGGSSNCLTDFGLPTSCNDIFVTKLVPDGSSLAYSTYLGGSHHDYATGIAINESGEAHVVGYTTSTDFPGATQTGIVVAKLNSSGSDLLYTVSIASPVSNAGHGIAVYNSNDIIITGAQNVPSEIYVARISDSGAPPPATPTNTAVPPTSTSVPPTSTSVPPTSTPLPPTNTPTPVPPTPTQQPSDNTMHSGDLDGRIAWSAARQVWRARVLIIVHDENHLPVAGAAVSGTWSGDYAGSAQCTTNSNGRCAVFSGLVPRISGSMTFALDNMTHSSFSYAPTDNHDGDGDSNGTMITLFSP